MRPLISVLVHFLLGAQVCAQAEEHQPRELVLITGATGRTGALLYRSLKQSVDVRALVRDTEKARTVLDCGACGEAEEIYLGDVTSSATLRTAFHGVTRLVILSASVPLKAENGTYYYPEGGFPLDVDYLGTKNQVVAAMEAGVKQILMVSSMGTTEPDSFLDQLGGGHALFYKLNGEAVVMSSNIPFTIVKPSGLLGEEVSGGERELLAGHDDALLKSKLNNIPRADVARVLVAALEMHELSTSLRFDLSSDPNRPATNDFKQLFHSARDLGVSNNEAPSSSADADNVQTYTSRR